MRDININVGQLVLFIILFMGVMPAASFAGFTLPMQYFLLPLFAIVTLLVFMGKYKIPSNAKIFLVFWILIVIEVIFAGFFSPLLEGDFNIPTEVANYLARFLFFTTFIVLFYVNKINLKKFMNKFTLVLSLGMLVAVLQFIYWPGSSFFREAYSFDPRHLEQMNSINLTSRRVSGVASFATATGGIAAFTGIMILSMHLFFKNRRWLTVLGFGLAVFNVVIAQARMGYLTVVFSVILLFFMYNIVYKNAARFFKSSFIFLFLLGIVSTVIYWLYEKGNDMVHRTVYRWQHLWEQLGQGENRLRQIDIALSQMDHPFNILFGISRGVEEGQMEIEPISIFVLYGAVGFILMYTLVAILLIYFYKNIKFVKQKRILLAMTIASFVGLISYVFFSSAYWFYREVYVGLFPWILMGATIGAIERFKRDPDAFDDEQGVSNEEEKEIKTRKRRKIVWS